MWFSGQERSPTISCKAPILGRPARTLLDKYHIDLNGAENGLKLTRRIHQTSGLQREKAIRDVTDQAAGGGGRAPRAGKPRGTQS